MTYEFLWEGIKLLVENSPFMLRCRSREMRTCSQKPSGEADPSRCQNGLKIVMLGCYVMLCPDILCQKINSTNECDTKRYGHIMGQFWPC